MGTKATAARAAVAFFSDKEFETQFLRLLGGTVYGCADIGECFATAARITDGDYESWWQEWRKTAEHTRTIGGAMPAVTDCIICQITSKIQLRYQTTT